MVLLKTIMKHYTGSDIQQFSFAEKRRKNIEIIYKACTMVIFPQNFFQYTISLFILTLAPLA